MGTIFQGGIMPHGVSICKLKPYRVYVYDIWCLIIGNTLETISIPYDCYTCKSKYARYTKQKSEGSSC